MPDLDKSLENLIEGKERIDLIKGTKSAYIKAMVFKNHEIWWDKIMTDMQSDKDDVRRAALIEFNKLQCRVLPTELTSPEDGGVVFKLVSYKDENNNPLIENQ